MRRGGPSPGSALTSAIAPSRGGSISTLSSGPSDSNVSGVGFEQVRRLEPRSSGEAVARGVLAGAADQRGAALDADDAGATARDRQREVADPAEEVGDPFARLRIEQADRAADQHPIDRRVDLRELGRSVGIHEVELRQRVGQRSRVGVHRRGGFRARRSAGRNRRHARCERVEGLDVGRRQRREDAQHQHARGVAGLGAGGVADRQLDLRQAIADGQAPTSAAAPAAAREMSGGRIAHDVMSAT